MPVNIYKRSYVVLNPEDKGCSFGGKEVSGYVKLEFKGNRGRITAALQNLNPAFSYNLKLLKLNGDTVLVDFGALKVDDKGRGGGEWSFEVEDVKGSGIKWEEFAVILVEAYDGEKFLVPLASQINRKNSSWKSAYRKHLIKKGIEENETHEEGTIEGKEVKVFPDSEIDYKEIGEDKEVEVSKEVLEVKKDEGETISEEVDYIKYLKEYVNNIVNFLEEIQPFERNLEGYRWWKVKTGYKEGSFDHYLVGFVKDEKGDLKYIVYGMPGFFTLSDQPFAGMTGFVVWKPVKEGFRGPKDEGYWLMHIDAKTGQIAVPIEPTPPPIIH
ncbi:hypothetical protein [Caldanaerobacter sp.]|uniref:hypothetical protein n=1 Tax=Caldanaerobacter sp. TaxID=2930036 RepID=UPI003C7531E9